MAVTLPVTLPKTVDVTRLKVKCTTALKLAYNTCVTKDLVAGHVGEVYARLEVGVAMPQHECQTIGASARFDFDRSNMTSTETGELEYSDVLSLVDTNWDKFVRVIVAGLIVTDGEKNIATKKPEKIILQIGVYMHDKSVRMWVRRFVDIDLAKYGIAEAPE